MYTPFRILLFLLISGIVLFPATGQLQARTEVPPGDTITRIDDYLTHLTAEKGFSGGLLIIRNGKKIFSKGYGYADKEKKIPFTSRTLCSMGSITKAFTAAAILKLEESGKLSVHDPLKKFFPTVPDDKAAITLHQLLTHSAGFHEFLENDGGDYEVVGTDDFLKRAFGEPLAFQPGEKAIYTNVGMSILGIIIEKVSGMEYEAYLRQHLFEPAGIRGIGYHVQPAPEDTVAVGYQNGIRWGTVPQRIRAAGDQPYWNLKANGGLEASLDDMFLWAKAISDHKLLSAETTERMFTRHAEEEGYDGRSFFGYGCNVQTSRRNTKMIDNGGSNGIYHARMIRLPEENVIFYMVTNEKSMNTNKVLPNITQLYFTGEITQDVVNMRLPFENELAEKIYEMLTQDQVNDLGAVLKTKNITVEDDMILLEAGQRLMEDRKPQEALVLYQYCTRMFPNIVMAWNDMGDVYQMLGNRKEAIRCYGHALKLRPGNPRAEDSLELLEKQ